MDAAVASLPLQPIRARRGLPARVVLHPLPPPRYVYLNVAQFVPDAQ